jgi:predicted phosphodiesterase
VIRLLHLSDIHFQTPQCLDPESDLDGLIRDRLIEDIKNLVDSDQKKVNAILISGDIAYKADEKEFAFAANWISEICEYLELSDKDVFVVPGNHDVNRNIAKQIVIKAQRDHILNLNGAYQAQAHQISFSQEAGATALLSPMEAYNKFAQRYGCEITPNNLRWSKELEIDEGVSLIINGLTSTLFSGEDDDVAKLYLSPHQCVLRKKNGCVHLTMMHHPTDWFRNSDEVKGILNEAAHIQLTGHKHVSRWEEINGHLHIAAEAMHPDRFESGSNPGYNLIDLQLSDLESEQSYVEVIANIRVLQTNPTKFVSKISTEKDGQFRHFIKINKLIKKILPESPSEQCQAKSPANSNNSTLSNTADHTEIRSHSSLTLKSQLLITKFLGFPQSVQIALFRKFDLWPDSKKRLTTQAINTAFNEARKMNILEELCSEIQLVGENK